MIDKITMKHGDGGKYTNDIIKNIFFKNFKNDILINSRDSASFNMNACKLAYTTDSFVVKPITFRGGDIGKLAICGTVNDLIATGAVPLYITCGFIIKEGFKISVLDKIAKSMGDVCKSQNVKIVAGDTKVIENGAEEDIYINTSGIGKVMGKYTPVQICPGDEILITGNIAEHGTVIMLERNELNLEYDFISDCNPLTDLLFLLGEDLEFVKLMTDPTRGGLATAVCEISEKQQIGIKLYEDKIPIDQRVKAVHELFGTDPLYFACEGRMIIVVKEGYGKKVLKKIKRKYQFQNAEIIGHVVDKSGIVRMTTDIGGEFIITPLQNQMVPRIC